jgi:hypothetical protein
VRTSGRVRRHSLCFFAQASVRNPAGIRAAYLPVARSRRPEPARRLQTVRGASMTGIGLHADERRCGRPLAGGKLAKHWRGTAKGRSLSLYVPLSLFCQRPHVAWQKGPPRVAKSPQRRSCSSPRPAACGSAAGGNRRAAFGLKENPGQGGTARGVRAICTDYVARSVMWRSLAQSAVRRELRLFCAT